MRKIDEYIGPIIIRFLLFFRDVNSLSINFKENVSHENLNKILVIKFFGIGSILLASPALREIKKKYPSAKITILTLHSNLQICEILPSIDQVIVLSLNNFVSFIVDYFRIISNLRKKEFDLIIDFEFLTNFSALTTLLISLFTKNISVGFLSPFSWRNRAYAKTVSFDYSRHISKIFLKVVSLVVGNNLELTFEKEKEALLNYSDLSFLEKLKLGEPQEKFDYIICVNVNAGELSTHRRWPIEYFVVLIKELINNPQIQIILIGGKEEVDYVNDCQRRLPSSSQITNLCGKISIIQLIGLFSKSDLLITNDSGPLHIAWIAGIPTVSFFGPETPYLYGPIGSNHTVFYKDLFCSPCLNIYNSKLSHCKDNVCLKQITPENVFKILKEKYLV